MEEIINDWGYLAVYLATTFEGEFAYLTAIVTAKLGHLTLIGVGIAGFLGGMTRDMSIFLGSRYGGKRLIENRPQLKSQIDTAGGWVSRRPWYLLIFHRYIYGLSTTTIIVLALSKMTNFHFFVLCIAACVVWVLGYGTIGYFAADQVLRNLDWIKDHFLWILLAIGLLIGSYKAYKKFTLSN